MRFPRTYIDADRQLVDVFPNEINACAAGLEHQKQLITGTTVIALVSDDKKVGVVVSDGRASMGNVSMKEDFPKVFDFRNGFVGVAGAVGVAQMLMRHFRIRLDMICDSRGEPMRASGAARGLFNLYCAASKSGPMALLSLFWDSQEHCCHLYKFEGMSLLTHDACATIGSGSMHIQADATMLSPGRTKDELLAQARDLLRKAGVVDKATNNVMFYGAIDNGQFMSGKEVLE